MACEHNPAVWMLDGSCVACRADAIISEAAASGELQRALTLYPPGRDQYVPTGQDSRKVVSIRKGIDHAGLLPPIWVTRYDNGDYSITTIDPDSGANH